MNYEFYINGFMSDKYDRHMSTFFSYLHYFLQINSKSILNIRNKNLYKHKKVLFGFWKNNTI